MKAAATCLPGRERGGSKVPAQMLSRHQTGSRGQHAARQPMDTAPRITWTGERDRSLACSSSISCNGQHNDPSIKQEVGSPGKPSSTRTRQVCCPAPLCCHGRLAKSACTVNHSPPKIQSRTLCCWQQAQVSRHLGPPAAPPEPSVAAPPWMASGGL